MSTSDAGDLEGRIEGARASTRAIVPTHVLRSIRDNYQWRRTELLTVPDGSYRDASGHETPCLLRRFVLVDPSHITQ